MVNRLALLINNIVFVLAGICVSATVQSAYVGGDYEFPVNEYLWDGLDFRSPSTVTEVRTPLQGGEPVIRHHTVGSSESVFSVNLTEYGYYSFSIQPCGSLSDNEDTWDACNSSHVLGAVEILMEGVPEPEDVVPYLEHVDLSKFDIYYGDFNEDGYDGDIYFHGRDIFVLIAGDVSIPLLLDGPQGFVYYNQGSAGYYNAVALDLGKSELDNYTKAKEGTDYFSGNGEQDYFIRGYQAGESVLRVTQATQGYPANNSPVITSFDASDRSLTLAFRDDNDDGRTDLVLLSSDDGYELDVVYSNTSGTLDEDYYKIYRGVLSGHGSVDQDGRFNYQIPIVVLPGIGKAVPQLSFSYNSDRGNGLLGLGWGLSGISIISRCPADYARDGSRSTINSGDNYKFCYNGQRLVKVGVREFRTEGESFARIKSFGGTKQSPTQWTVEQKDGSKLHFGATANSRKQDASGNNRYWGVSSFSDLAGNSMHYSYNSYGYISGLSYGENGSVNIQKRLAFEYESRPDVKQAFVAGVSDFPLERLSEVKIFVRNQLYQNYQLDYDDFSPGRYRTDTSRIAAIRRCRISDTACDAFKTIEWDKEVGTEGFTEEIDAAYFGSGDFDNDGNLDTLHITKSGNTYQVYKKPLRGGDQELWATTTKVLTIRPQIVDMTGDGLDDVVFFSRYHLAGFVHPVVVLRSLGDSFVAETWAAPYSEGFDKRHFKQVMDIDGNGLPDLVVVDPEYGVSVRRNTGSAFGEWELWHQPYSKYWDLGTAGGLYKRARGPKFGDVNGDGLPDFTNCESKETVCTPFVYLNRNGSFEKQDWGVGSIDYRNSWLTDVNGDGLSDLVRISSSGNYDYINVSISDGISFRGPEDWGNGGLDLASLNFELFADLNGDGCSDLVQVASTAAPEKKIKVALSTCSQAEGFEFARTWIESTNNVVGPTGESLIAPALYDDVLEGFTGARGRAVLNQLYSPPLISDINSDGVLDLITHFSVFISDGGKRRVKKIYDFDGIGESANDIVNGTSVVVDENSVLQVTYRNLMGSGIYTGFASKGAITDPISRGKGKKVVSSVVNSHRASLQEMTTYKYANYVATKNGIGSYGFERVTNYSIQSSGDYKKIVNSFFHGAGAAYSTRGLLKSQEVYVKASGAAEESLIQRKMNSWEYRSLDSDYSTEPYYFRRLKSVSEEEWDLAGDAVATSRTNYFSWAASSLDCSAVDPAIYLVAAKAPYIHTTSNGALKYSRTVTCDTAESEASIVAVGIARSDFVDITTATDWVLDLSQSVQVTKWVGSSIDNTVSETRSHSFTYYVSGDSLGMVNTETAGSTEGLSLSSEYDYNNFGSISSVVQTWTVPEALQTKVGLSASSIAQSFSETYSSQGERTIVKTNALDQAETTVYSRYNGEIKTYTDENNLSVNNIYSSGGWLASSIDKAGVSTKNEYLPCDSCFSYNTAATWMKVTDTQGSATVVEYFDDLGRGVGTRTTGLTDRHIYTYKKYNWEGELAEESAPFYTGGSENITRYQYDLLGRLDTVSYADDTQQTFAYHGLTKKITNRESQVQSHTYNKLGWHVKSVDNEETPVEMSYWPWGELKWTIVNNDATTKIFMTYDSLGNQRSLDDPSAGLTTWVYSPLSHLTYVTDANDVSTAYTYDVLGRQKTRTDYAGDDEKSVTHDWHYDESPFGIGQLSSVEGLDTDGNAYQESYTYTSKGLPSIASYLIEGNSYSVTQHYDSLGRPSGIGYPSGFTTRNVYKTNGYLWKIEHAVTGQALWQANYGDARGNITQSVTGNNVTTTRSYDPVNGRVDSIAADFGADSIQDHTYAFSPLGNLEQRTDGIANVTEYFCYDGLNRLKASRFSACSANDEDYTYSALGNILTKKGVSGSYSYSGFGPYAVSDANGLSYAYDAAGNITQAVNASGTEIKRVEYTAFNKPSYIRNGSDETSINYGVTQSRISRAGSHGVKSTYIADALYEIKQLEGNPSLQKIHYIGDFAMYIVDEGSAAYDSFVYLHRDHLGSLVSKSDEYGESLEELAFSPWGSRLDGSWGAANINDSYVSFDSSRGFTGHEHMDEVGLIHMNGRVFDPELGRFLSPDPLVQAPTFTQSYNRYSYVFNNPLSFVDPTGYCSEYSYESNAPCGGMTFLNSFSEAFEQLGLTIDRQVERMKEVWKEGMIMGATGGMPFGTLGRKVAVRYTVGLVVKSGASVDNILIRSVIKGGDDVAKSIPTPYGAANQATDAASVAARGQVQNGATLYRSGTTGKSQAAEAQFWSLESPLSPGYASRYGIPASNVKNANFIETATVKPGSPFITRPAPAVGSNVGGGIEVVVPQGGVKMRAFNFGGQ